MAQRPSYRHENDMQLATIVNEKTAVGKVLESGFDGAQKAWVGTLATLNKPQELIKAMLPNLKTLGQVVPFLKPNPNVIRIKIDSNSVAPGDTITGVVKLMISEPVAVEDIKISLFGRAQTYAGLSNAYRARVPFESYFKLVDVAKDLEFEHSSVLQPKIYDVPFEIELPRTVTITQEDWPFDENTRRFNSNFTQPLPPSFVTYSTAHAHADCSIKYFVIADLISPEKKSSIKHKIPLIVKMSDARALMGTTTQSTCYMKAGFRFRLSSAPGKSDAVVLEADELSRGASVTSMENDDSTKAGPSTTVSEVASGSTTPAESTLELIKSPTSPSSPTSPLSPGGSSRRSYFKAFAKDNLLRFTLPEYHFDLDAEIPRGGRISQTLPIVLKLTFQPPKSKKAMKAASRPPPPMTLTAMQVQIQARFMTRGITKDKLNDVAYAYVAPTATWHVVWRSKPLIISQLKNPVVLGPETDMSQHMFVQPHKFLPAFKTFSIAREYVLNVVCELTCAGEKFRAVYEVEGFNILAEFDGLQDDFATERPKIFRRPGAHNDYDDMDDIELTEFDRNDSGYTSSDEEGREAGADVVGEDELFQGDAKHAAHKVTVNELFGSKDTAK